jgi:hypothetical protein
MSSASFPAQHRAAAAASVPSCGALGVAAAKFSSAVPLTVGAIEAEAKSVLGAMGPASAPGGGEAQQCLRVGLLRVFGAGLSGQPDGF